MKIRLKNFRCYSDETFDFGEGGLALLSGPSGKGKSTILMGIYFALFGTGSKVTAYGKTSCLVELEFDGMKIMRTKRPNHLVVNEVYEDASGQEIINKKFGDTFNVTGYISQNALNSFILMSPIEKLGFLEKFAFRDIELGTIKRRCKAHISKCHDELLGTICQLDMAKNVLGEMGIPNEVKFPLKCKKSQRKQAIKNEGVRLKNCNILIRREEKVKTNVEGEINSLNILEATLQSRKETKKELDDKLDDLGIEMDDLIYEGDDILEEAEKHLETSLGRRELRVMEDQLENDQNKLEEMRKEESDGLEEELGTIDVALWKEYSKDELKETMIDLKRCISDVEKVEGLRKEVMRCNIDPEKHEEHKKELDEQTIELDEKQKLCDKLNAQQELYSCPSCMAKLRLINEELFQADNVDNDNIDVDLDILESELESLKHNISKLQRIIPDESNKLERKVEVEAEISDILSSYEEPPNMDGLKEDLEYLRGYQASQFEIEKKKREIEKSIKNEKFSSSYQRFKRSVKKLHESITELQNSCGECDSTVYNEEELRAKIIEQKQIRDKIGDYEKRKDKMEENRDRCNRIIDNAMKKHVEKYGVIHDKDELTEILFLHETKIEETEIKKRRHGQTLKQIENWEHYQEELGNYQIWETKVDDLTVKEKEGRNKYASATKLKDSIVEAESIAVVNIVESINTHARLYLDAFFVEDPISVQLQSFKQTNKSNKPKINIQIEYKGMEADMNMLSGGELSRVILAYTLALAEMFNTPLLLLDECTASLDQDLTSVVFEAIRENFNGKMTLIIAHQVVTGTFDKSVKL